MLLWACGAGWCLSFLCWAGEQLGWGVTWAPSGAIVSPSCFTGEQPSSLMDNPAGPLFNSFWKLLFRFSASSENKGLQTFLNPRFLFHLLRSVEHGVCFCKRPSRVVW